MYSDVLDIILIAQLLDDKSGVAYSTEPGRWINQGSPRSTCRHVVQIKGLSLFPFGTILRVQVTFQHYKQQWEILGRIVQYAGARIYHDRRLTENIVFMHAKIQTQRTLNSVLQQNTFLKAPLDSVHFISACLVFMNCTS
jgi:hypothetical protein